MKQIKMCYSVRNNLGDKLNVLISEKIFGYKAIFANPYECNISGIGSGLGRFFMPVKDIFTSVEGMKKYVVGHRSSESCVIWSAGFLSSQVGKEIPLRRKIEVASVRGELSKERVEKAVGRKLNITTGDGGLLASELLRGKIEKKYTLGIIPHEKERGEPKFKAIADSFKHSIIIDVTGDTDQVLREISSCELILSSSLHGLIVADSFGIPNRRAILTSKLAGDGFKFRDYYSSFHVSPEPINLNNTANIRFSDIEDKYFIEEAAVEKKKEEIKYAFARYTGG